MEIIIEGYNCKKANAVKLININIAVFVQIYSQV